ncbi:MAG: hypothetical protein PWP23_1052 [Candidatus Sumerlaeota bacterium]|nr:hypothetical protein [Candidatus Sumerlaeota bacterium]
MIERETQDSWGSGHSAFQKAGAGLGLLVIVIGLVLVLVLFFKVLGYLNDPASFKETLDGWEAVLKGDGKDAGKIRVEFGEPQSGAIPTNQTQPFDMPFESLTIPLNLYRPGAAVLVLLILGLLARLAIGIMKGGGHLVQLANPWKQMFEHAVRDFARYRTGRARRPRWEGDSIPDEPPPGA